MQRRPGYRRGQLEMGQMKRCVKDVERAVANLVVGELSSLVRIFFVDSYKPAGIRCGAHGVVHDASPEHGLRGQQFRQFAYVSARWTAHAAARYAEAGR